MLAVNLLCAGYRDLIVLHDVSLSVGEGEAVGLVGANAAGKTTLARALTGLVRPVGGEIFWDGVAIRDLPAYRRPALGLVMVPEGRSLFGFMSVRENLEMGASNSRGRANAKRSLELVMDLFPVLGERINTTARKLSGGQQQMLAVGRALMACPRLLILDEPSVGLGPKIVAEIYQLLSRVFRENISILLIEQDVRRCLSIVQRAYVIAQGRIVMEGSAETLLGSDDVRRTYLGL